MRELTLRTEDTERTLFWDAEKPFPLAVGATVTFCTVGNTVVGYEVTA